LLRALQSTRPAGEVIAPASRIGKETLGKEHLLLPEGTAIVERPGRLVRQGDGWDFQPDDGRAIGALPSAQLEIMVTMHKDSGGVMPFLVSGEVTMFGNRNYLLIKHAARAGGSSAKSAPAVASPVRAVPSDASTEDVLSALQGQRSGQTSLQDEMHSTAESASTGQSALLEGSLIVRRSGRMMRDGTRWAFHFDDEQATGLSAIKLLPNQSLEVMVRSAERGASGLVYIVSGETTHFDSESFLLVRGVTRMPDLGNLRP